VLVDGPFIPHPGDSIRSIVSPEVMATIRQVLVARPPVPVERGDGLAAARVEQAVAWMFGMCPSPLFNSPFPVHPDG
jgi:UDP-N-acetylglucosamine 2-epimerase (non-hydrolysing)